MYHKYIFSEVIKKIIHDIKFFSKIRLSKLIKSIRLIKKSKAQLRQDLFVLTHLDFKTQGFFVEFGATDGIHLSNSYLLEREFDWSGILAEPAKSFEVALRYNRPNAKIETLCIYKDSDLIKNRSERFETSPIEPYHFGLVLTSFLQIRVFGSSDDVQFIPRPQNFVSG